MVPIVLLILTLILERRHGEIIIVDVTGIRVNEISQLRLLFPTAIFRALYVYIIAGTGAVDQDKLGLFEKHLHKVEIISVLTLIKFRLLCRIIEISETVERAGTSEKVVHRHRAILSHNIVHTCIRLQLLTETDQIALMGWIFINLLVHHSRLASHKRHEIGCRVTDDVKRMIGPEGIVAEIGVVAHRSSRKTIEIEHIGEISTIYFYYFPWKIPV